MIKCVSLQTQFLSRSSNSRLRNLKYNENSEDDEEKTAKKLKDEQYVTFDVPGSSSCCSPKPQNPKVYVIKFYLKINFQEIVMGFPTKRFYKSSFYFYMLFA